MGILCENMYNLKEIEFEMKLPVWITALICTDFYYVFLRDRKAQLKTYPRYSKKIVESYFFTWLDLETICTRIVFLLPIILWKKLRGFLVSFKFYPGISYPVNMTIYRGSIKKSKICIDKWSQSWFHSDHQRLQRESIQVRNEQGTAIYLGSLVYRFLLLISS